MNSSNVWKDFTMLLVMAFFVMVVWMLPHLNPPAVEDRDEPPGNLIVHISWPKGNTDVDLWLMAPGEPRAVGYSNKSGAIWNLLRDDVGDGVDMTDLNYENAYTRGIPPGEYVFNLHCYRCPVLPVEVVMEIRVKSPEGDKGSAPLLQTRATLVSNSEEITAVRFRLDKSGKLVEGSMNHFFEQLRAATSSPMGGREGR